MTDSYPKRSRVFCAVSLCDDAISRQQAYRGLMSELLDLEIIAKIRHCANTGLVLGTEKFRKQVAVLVE